MAYSKRNPFSPPKLTGSSFCRVNCEPSRVSAPSNNATISSGCMPERKAKLLAPLPPAACTSSSFLMPEKRRSWSTVIPSMVQSCAGPWVLILFHAPSRLRVRRSPTARSPVSTFSTVAQPAASTTTSTATILFMRAIPPGSS
jgi:hypothetical protein